MQQRFDKDFLTCEYVGKQPRVRFRKRAFKFPVKWEPERVAMYCCEAFGFPDRDHKKATAAIVEQLKICKAEMEQERETFSTLAERFSTGTQTADILPPDEENHFEN